MGKGNYGALKQLTPIQADFGKIARDQEQIEAQKMELKRRQERDRKEDERYQKAEKKANYKDLEDALAKNQLVTTGAPVIDEKLAKLFLNNAESITRNWEQKQLATDDATLAKLYLEASNLYNIPKQIEESMQTISNYTGMLEKGLADGTLSESQNAHALDTLNSFIRDNSLEITHDDKGMVVYKIGQGNNKRAITQDEFLKGALLPELVFKFNTTEFKKEVGDLGTHLSDVQSGYVTVGGKTLTKSASDYLQGKVEEEVGTKDNPSGTAMSIWLDDWKRKDPFDWQKVHDYVLNIGLSGVDTQYSKKVDLSAMRQDQENANKTNGKNTPKAVDGIQPMRYSDGNLIEFPSANASKTNKSGLGFTTEKPVTVGIGNSKIEVNTFYIGADGLITYEGQKLVKGDPLEGDKWVKVTNDPIKGEDANIFARALSFKSAYELTKEARAKAYGTYVSTGSEALSKEEINKKSDELINRYSPKN